MDLQKMVDFWLVENIISPRLALVTHRSFRVHHFFSTKNRMLFWLIPSTLVLCGFLPPLARSLVCSDGVYGNPKIDDCQLALLEIPYARQPIDSHQSSLPHVFAEPQFLRPPFRQFTNTFRSQSIIQLPKIWKHSKLSSKNELSLKPYAIHDRASN